MAPKKKEYSNVPRILIIRHYQNDDLLSEIEAKTLFSRSTVLYVIDKYKSTKCIGNLFGRAHIWKTRATADRLIQRKLKFVRRKSAFMVKIEIENELGISLHIDTIRRWIHEVRRVARKERYENKINQGKRCKFDKEMLEKSADFWKNAV